MKIKFSRQVGSVIASPFMLVWRSLDRLGTVQNRERIRLWGEMNQMRGLMPLLMKQRNGYRWTAEDRKEIKAQLYILLSLSPYLVLFLSPGAFITLPALAWWLDRRRLRRIAEAR